MQPRIGDNLMTDIVVTRTPIWKSIADTLAAEIAAGHYRPGDKLPTEAALAQRFGVNRHTVRQALASHAATGMLHSRRGSGVFVAAKPTRYPLGRRVRYHQSLAAAGQSASKAILRLETRASDEGEATQLGLATGDPVHVYEGISLADNAPIALFRSVFPAMRFPGLLGGLDRTHSVTAAFAAEGLADYTRARTEITAKTASAAQALHLRIAEGAAILRTDSLNIDTGGAPVEIGRTWFAGDRVSLLVSVDDA
jgi:GntR family phosphonate transport system transcriptional regulator